MNSLTTTLREFVRDLAAQKLRTTLTVFGIVWGTVAIIVLLAFGMGFKRQLSINMHGIGESVAIMFPGRTTKTFEGFGVGRPMSLREDDVHLLTSQVSGIDRISPEYSQNETPVRVGENITTPLISGVVPVYGDIRNIIPEQGGRFINDPDVRDRKRVAVLGNDIKRLLFGDTQAIGRLIYVGTVPFTVIGVMQKKTQNSSYNRRDQDRIFIPSSTFASVFGANRLNNIIFTSKDPRHSVETVSSVRTVLGRKYRFDPTDKDAIWIWDTAEFDKFVFVFFLAFNIFMGLIGSFTLAVGGLGVANIMYIVVQERTREIGVKRAVGARKRDILFQFFSESILIVAFGSLVGFGIAALIVKAMQYVPIKEFVGTPEFSSEVALATVAVLAVVSLSAGLLPARRAANLNVVDCLRSG
jgi:putative ABC transport system permease protein